MEPVFKAGQFAQYLDDIRIAAHTATDLTRKFRAVFKYIRQTRLKLTIEKRLFGARQTEFLGIFTSSERVSQQALETQKLIIKVRLPKSKEALQRCLGFVKKRKKNSQDGGKAQLILQFFKAEVPINITSEMKETFDSVNKALSGACDLALQQQFSGKQLILTTDASF